jgi:type IV pilus assembly protein PilC
MYFDNLYCNLVEAGESAGILDQLLDRLAVYMEKTEAIKSKIKSALMYPISVLVVAFVVVAVIMIFVIPAFKEVFSNFGGELPSADAGCHRHQRVLCEVLVSDLWRTGRWLLLLSCRPGNATKKCSMFMDRIMLKLPIFGVTGRKVMYRTLDTHLVHHVCRRRALWLRRWTPWEVQPATRCSKAPP